MQIPAAATIGDGPKVATFYRLPRSVEWGPNAVYLPVVRNDTVYPCYMDAQASALLDIMRKDAQQKRSRINCNPKLMKVAQHRANDMNARRYFAHYDPEGNGPNYWARFYGCELPSYYPVNGNSIESIAINYPSLESVWDAWMASPSHESHLRGLHQAYALQVDAGVAVLNGSYGLIYVIVTAEPC